MRKKNTSLFILVLLWSMISCSCFRYPFPPDFPVEGVPPQNVNSYVRIYLPNGWDYDEIGDPIVIKIENISDEILIFPRNFNSQSYLYSDYGWILQEKITDIGEGYVMICPSKEGSLENAVEVFFPILDFDNSINLRVVITGHVFRNGKPTNTRVGAYTDVRLKLQSDRGDSIFNFIYSILN